MKVKTVDVDKFAEEFNVERNIAYGFLRFISEAKLVRTGKRPQPKGKKGKPATLFHLDPGLGDRLVEYLGKNLKNIPDVELDEKAAAEQACAEESAATSEQVTTTLTE